MKKLISLLFILGIVSSCGEHRFKIGDCVQSSYGHYTYFITDVGLLNYGLTTIKPSSSVLFNTFTHMRHSVADKVMKRVDCEL